MGRMMNIPKKKTILTGCVVIFVLGIVAIVLWVKLMPGEKIATLVGTESEISQVLCTYPVKVQGDSMMPIFKHGDTVNFNKCIEDKENVSLDTIIVYKSNGALKMGRIREVVDGESGVFYKVSPEARAEDLQDVYPDRVICIYKE